MKINITQKEYRLLVEMLYLADWMMHSNTVGLDAPDVYEKLRKKILSYYKEMEAEDIIEYSLDDYYEVGEYEDIIHKKFITAYDEAVFWDELIDRLAVRDMVKKMGVAAYQAMKGIDRITPLEAIKDHYVNEFERHGLEHVEIVHSDLTKSIELSTDLN